jgi:hypothetical protein
MEGALSWLNVMHDIYIKSFMKMMKTFTKLYGFASAI